MSALTETLNADDHAGPSAGDVPLARQSVDALFDRVANEFAAPLERLARAHEADPALQQDLLQDIHLALWRSLGGFNERCSLRTWVYRVAHNVAATHLLRQKRTRLQSLTTIDELSIASDEAEVPATVDEQLVLTRLTALIHRLKPVDRQLIILHLEGIAADDIAEIAGLSVPNVHTKLHRIRELLAARIHSGDDK